MEKNKKDKKKDAKSKSVEDNNAPLAVIFEYDELTIAVLSHLTLTELFGVRGVCKKWSYIINEPMIWKGVITSTYGVFLGPEYRNILNTASGADLQKAIRDPAFARTLFTMDKYFVDNEDVIWEPDVLGIPKLIKREALHNFLFSDKPIWRSPWLTNAMSKTNNRCFVLPHFQPHDLPQGDSLFMQIFFYSIVIDDSRFITAQEVWDVLEARAKTPDRPKAIAIICQWIANFYWHRNSETLDPLLEQFLETTTNDERKQIEHAKQLQAQNKVFDWEENDRKYIAKLTTEQLKALKVNIKPKLLQKPINIMDIPPREMAKQIALIEQKILRSFTLESFIYRKWNAGPIARFNLIAKGLTHWIITQPTVEKRYEACAYLVKLAYELVQIRCISGVVLINSSLNMNPIMRLNSTKKAFKKFPKEAEEVRSVSSPDGSYKRLREFLNESKGEPTVPFLGMSLIDVTFIFDGNDWFVDGMINLRKTTLYVDCICSLLKHQFVPYLYEPVEPLQQLWEDFASQEYNEEQLYELSLAIKARGSDTKETDGPNQKK